MAEITINGVKYTNVPNKKAGTKFAASLTQSNIGASQAVQDYVNSAYFYPLVNAIDINWNGVEVEENSYINTTSDLISYIASKESNIDLSSYATMAYVDQKITDLIGGAPETLDTLKELADALEDEASLAYVTQALDGKADKSSLTNYATNSYVTTELDKKADKSQLPDMTNYSTVSYVTTELDKKANKSEIPSMPDLTPYVSYEQANSYYVKVTGNQNISGIKTFVGNKLINFRQSTSSDKLGFTLFNNNKKDVGGLEYRPDTINGKSLISLQHYVASANMSTIAQSYLGFRQTQGNNKYHLLAPIPADVATIETITSSDYRNFFMPLVFQNGSNKVYANCAGLVDMASLMPDLNDYATNSYVTTELDKKADKTQLPDMTNYVSVSSYNALYEEVQHLAYLISYYHPIKLNIPARPKEGYTFDSTRGGQTSTKTLIDIDEDDNTKDYWDNNLWSATSSNNDFSVSFLELASKTQNVGTNVKFNITLPQATNNDQSTNITVNFAGSNDYNAETWTIPITLTASGGKQETIPTGWTYDGNMMNELLFVIGDSTSTPTTYAFTSNPSDGWEFATTMEPPINGVSIDSTTYNITVTPSLLDTTGEWNMHVERQEDSQYWRGEVNTPFIVVAAGTDPTFNFHTSEMWISNEEATTTKELYDSIGEIEIYAPTVTSSNTSIVTATVDPNDNTNIIITFVDEGDATVTATITNPSTGVTRTATMTVHATVNREWIDAHLVNASNDDPADNYYGLPKNSGAMHLNFIANRAYSREPVIGFSTTVVGDTYNAITITHAETTNNDSIAFSVRVDTSKLANMNDWDDIEIQIERAQDSTTSGYSDSRHLCIIPQGADPGMYWSVNNMEMYVGTYYDEGTDIIYNRLVSNIGGTPTVTIADTTIAHMDGNSIYGDSVGTTTITATVTDGNNNTRTATIPVNVIAGE